MTLPPGPGGRGQSGAIVEDRVAVQVLADDDVKGRPGIGDDEWAEPQSVGQRNSAADEHPIADIEGCPPVIFHGIVGVHHELRRELCLRQRPPPNPPPPPPEEIETAPPEPRSLLAKFSE